MCAYTAAADMAGISNHSSFVPQNETSTSRVNSNCFHKVQLKQNLLLKYQVNEDVSNLKFITAELIYDGFAWLSIGITEENVPLMVGSQAIIGILNDDEIESEPKMYSMTGTFLDGVNPLWKKYQTLFEHKIEETDKSTILSFSKYLEEPGHLPLSTEGPVVLLYGVGTSHRFATHEFYGAFKIDLSEECIPDMSEDESNAKEATILADPFKNVWRLHGILAGLAWAIATPMAIFSSANRTLLPPGKMWLQSHKYLNWISFILTIGSVVIGVVVFIKSGKMHFSKPHHIIGFLLLILCFMQMVGGTLRPPPADPPTKNRLRWQKIHKIMGISCYVLSIYQVGSGLQLYSSMNQEWNWVPIYAGWTALVTGAVYYSRLVGTCQRKPTKN